MNIARKNKLRKKTKELDRYDLIAESILDDTIILEKPENQKLQENVLMIYPLLCGGKTSQQIFRILKRLKIIKNDSYGYKLIRATERVFGKVQVANKAGMKAIAIEMAKKAYQRALMNSNATAMVRATDLIAKLSGVLDKQQDFFNVFIDLQLPQVSFTSDPKALEIEDVEYQEVEENEES